MKTNLSITFLQVLFLIALQAFAFDGTGKSDFDFNFLNTTFKVKDLADCNDVRFHNAEIKITYYSGRNEIEITANDNIIQIIKFLNVGKTEFSTCWSTGTKGFYQNEIFANKITYKKVLYATGSLCSEGSRLSLEEQELSFSLEGLSVKTKFMDDKNNQITETSCQLNAIRTR
jgi:hypothetical protein